MPGEKGRETLRNLPTLGVVSVESFLREVLVPAVGFHVFAGLHTCFLGILLQVGNVLRGVAALEHRRASQLLLLSLPNKVKSERLGKFSRQHVSSGGAGREGCREVDMRSSCRDGLSAGSRNFADGFKRRVSHALHHKRRLIGVIGRRTQARSIGRRASSMNSRRRLRGLIAECPGSLILRKHERDERWAGGKVGL